MVTHSSILAWRIPGTEEPGGLHSPWGLKESDMTKQLSLHFTSLVAQMVKNLPSMQETWIQSLDQEDQPGEGHGYPLKYSCLENPMNRGT